jgi:hypothetical protein
VATKAFFLQIHDASPVEAVRLPQAASSAVLDRLLGRRKGVFVA